MGGERGGGICLFDKKTNPSPLIHFQDPGEIVGVHVCVRGYMRVVNCVCVCVCMCMCVGSPYDLISRSW